MRITLQIGILFFLFQLSDVYAQRKDKIIIFSKTKTFRHKSIEPGIESIIKLGKSNGFLVQSTENANEMISGLSSCKAVIFLNTTGDILNKVQQRKLKKFINRGGGFVGVHAAADTEHNWSWYGKMIGAYFESHPKRQEAKIKVIDTKHLSTRLLDSQWIKFDEWYNYKNISPDINVLMQLDESSYEGGKNGKNHPIAWYHRFGGGRIFYTGLGHTSESYQNPIFLKHLLGGILYAMTSDQEAGRQWISLFNGKDLNHWNTKIKGHLLGENYKNTFRVVNGCIQVNYDNYDKFNGLFGHLFYENSYSNYKLRLQYRFIGSQAKGGEGWANRNSGVMLHCQSPQSMTLNQNFPVSIEVQLLGGIKERVSRPTANVCTPGTHIILEGKFTEKHCINSSSKTYYDNRWINLEVLVHNDSVISHWINGKKVISYTKPIIGGEYNTLLEKEGQKLKGGYISLQSESHPIEFRNIELLEIVE